MDDDLLLNLNSNSNLAARSKKVNKVVDNNQKRNEQKSVKVNSNDDLDDRSANSRAKSAKFSSLFKNNPEIPRVENSEAKYEVKEGLFSSETFSTFTQLHPYLVSCLEQRFKLTKMTQIQEKTIPEIMNGHDCFVKSQTGSGKTLAYAVPIIQLLQQKEPKISRKDGIYVLVLVPTRELATQTCTVFETLCQPFIRILAGALIGGVKKKAEKDRIRKGLNILIATPGRLCDHLDTTTALDLSKVEYLIFDEADRMLDLDFEKKINFIIFKLNQKRKELNTKRPQTLLISATLTNGVKEIARRMNVENPVNIEVQSSTKNNETNENVNTSSEQIALPSGLTQYYLIVPTKLRLISLISFILNCFVYEKLDFKKIIVFTATNDGVLLHQNLLSTFLNHKFDLYFDDDDNDMDYLKKSREQNKDGAINVFSLCGNMEQHDRNKTLNEFTKANTGILVCTDVAARGLDIPNVDWIVQYNTPGTCHDYVHRVGRTARVGQTGKALIYLQTTEIEYIKKLNECGISLKELKLKKIMDCLCEEAKYYPRQVNADRLIVAKNAEDCANSMQFYIEEYIEKNNQIHELARKAYTTFLRSYSTYSKEWKEIFHVKNLHLGHLAKSFGLREAPTDIVSHSQNHRNASSSGSRRSEFNNNFNNNKREFNGKRKYQQELDDYLDDGLSMNDIGGGGGGDDGDDDNKMHKKTKLFQSNRKSDHSGLAGLLRNHKQVDEYSSGFDSMKTKSNKKNSKKSTTTITTNNNNNNNNNRKRNKLSLNERLKKSTTKFQINKQRDMSIFD